jgi:hypothetical protein
MSASSSATRTFGCFAVAIGASNHQAGALAPVSRPSLATSGRQNENSTAMRGMPYTIHFIRLSKSGRGTDRVFEQLPCRRVAEQPK